METTYNPIKKEMTTTHSLGQAKEHTGNKIGERRLTISTYKHERDIITRADVSLHLDGFTQHAFGLARDGSGDYSKRLQRVPCPRVSEKVIKAAHAALEWQFEGILAQAREHYSKQEDKAA